MTAAAHVPRPIVLAILDGWGIAKPGPGNAIANARTPVMDALWKKSPHVQLAASGPSVGLPSRQEGNSEAGHINIGAGRVVDQESVIIARSLKDGTFAKNPAFAAAFQHVRKHGTRLHLMGILSDGPSTHSDPEHLYALLDVAHKARIPEVYLHLFTDGRDSPQYIAPVLLKRLKKYRHPEQQIATIAGRYYLDRKKRWKTTEEIYHALVRGTDNRAESSSEAVTRAYNQQHTDEFIPPTMIALTNGAVRRSRIRNGDSVIFFNFRSDRARQLTKAFVQPQFNARNPRAFRRRTIIKKLTFVAMTDFGPDLGRILTAFPARDLKQTLPMQFLGARQVYIAETEKYAHMTFFLNGGYDAPVAGEERILIPSPKVASYDTVPGMSAAAITTTALAQLRDPHVDFLALNYANVDMLGHTGNFTAAVKGIEVVDREVGTLRNAVLRRGGALCIVGDHGNAEVMLNPVTKEVMTEHTTNPVPFIVTAPPGSRHRLRAQGKLADVAPTILALAGRTQPRPMTGKSLFRVARKQPRRTPS